MEHIFSEVQLCIKISISKEVLNIDILINLCLGTSLMNVSGSGAACPPAMMPADPAAMMQMMLVFASQPPA